MYELINLAISIKQKIQVCKFYVIGVILDGDEII